MPWLLAADRWQSGCNYNIARSRGVAQWILHHDLSSSDVNDLMPLADLNSTMLLLAIDLQEPWLPLWLLEAGGHLLLLGWLFAVGACIGSFLNVVVYRLPMGLNLVHPSSHCPRCLAPIRWRHNIPIFGWLLLRGRCYDCRLPISPRYPLVELLIGLLFVSVAWLELFRSNAYEVPATIAFTRPLLEARHAWPFWLAYATHVLLLTTLVGAALMELDRRRVPWRLYVPILFLAFFAQRFWPEIRRIPWSHFHLTAAWEAWLADGVAGLTMGLLLGLAIGWMWWLARVGEDWPRFAPACMLAGVGIVVGWQLVSAMLPLILLVWLAIIVTQRLMDAQWVFPLSGIVGIGILPGLLASDWGLELLFKVTSVAPAAWILSILTLVACLSFVIGAITPAQYLSNASPALSPEALTLRETNES